MKHLFAFPTIFVGMLTCWMFLGVVSAATPALAEYKLQAGDTLEIAVTGVPDLRQRAPIGVDGVIALPLVGSLKVGGLPISEARARIVDALANKRYSQSTNDGRDVEHLILSNAIVVTVVEYRPIYVSGDVAKPGEYPFRPGMTVRQAIAVAGGYDVVRFHVANPFIQAADFKSDYDSLWVEFAMEQALIWRLRTELGEKDVEYAAASAPISADLRQRLKQIEVEHLKARLADREKDKSALLDSIAKANLQLGILTEKKKKDEEGNQADMADFERIRELALRGITPGARLAEVRRAALFSSEQLMQTVVEMSNIERQRGDYNRQLGKIDTQARIDDWRDLQAAELRLSQITARLRSTSEKLMYTGALQSELLHGLGKHPEITVHRKADGRPENLPADEDLELAPGDVVEVVIETKNMAQAAPTPSKAIQ